MNVFKYPLVGLIFCLTLSSGAASQKVLLQNEPSQLGQQFLMQNPGMLSLSDFWEKSFHEINPRLESLLDLCLLELTGSPSPESCESYFLMRAEVPMGGFDEDLFQKLKQRIKTSSFKDEKLKKWLSPEQNTKKETQNGNILSLQKKWGFTKVLIQGKNSDPQFLNINQVYQWTFLREDSLPVTLLGSFEDISKMSVDWTRITPRILQDLESQFAQVRFIQFNPNGQPDSEIDHRLTDFQTAARSELKHKKSWGQWKLPTALLLTGLAVHLMKDKEVRITGFSF